jgi:hypothetical protein
VLHEADTRKHALGHSELSYETLLSRHSIGGAPEIRQKLLRWMHEAEAGVMQSDRVQRRYEHQASLVKCAVFSWTCTRIKVCFFITRRSVALQLTTFPSRYS